MSDLSVVCIYVRAYASDILSPELNYRCVLLGTVIDIVFCFSLFLLFFLSLTIFDLRTERQ